MNNAKNLSVETKLGLKTNFLNCFKEYSNIKVNSKDKHIINQLYTNGSIVILRQDKGRGVVILNRTDYITKCETFLNGPEFEQLTEDPTTMFHSSVQNKLRKMKKKFEPAEYNRLYPSASQPGLFFGLAKVHKLKEGQNDVKDLPLRPVISNIGTTTYQISKNLAKLLAPLTKSEYNIESTKEFIDKLKQLKIDEGYKMVSLDVVSLFTSVPLDYTINVILDQIYKDKMIKTKLTRTELKSLLELCTKKMHFSFNGKIYKQTNGVAMGSPLGPVLANIFMVHLEKTMVPQLNGKMSSWYRYVDDTFTFIKDGEIENVRESLNNFHEDIKFTYETEIDGKIPFLDVNVKRKDDGTFDTEVYRKKTDSNIYINWSAYASRTWKIGTLKGLFRRAFMVCSTKAAQLKEIQFLKNVFTKTNGYPSRVVNDALHQVRNKINSEATARAERQQEQNLVQAQEHGQPSAPQQQQQQQQQQQRQQLTQEDELTIQELEAIFNSSYNESFEFHRFPEEDIPVQQETQQQQTEQQVHQEQQKQQPQQQQSTQEDELTIEHLQAIFNSSNNESFVFHGFPEEDIPVQQQTQQQQTEPQQIHQEHHRQEQQQQQQQQDVK